MSLRRLVDQCQAMGATATFVARLDDDDEALPEYRRIDFPATWQVVIGPRVKPGGAMRETFARWPDEDFYTFIGDDELPRTLGFDRLLAEAAGPWGIAYPDDGIHEGHKATQPFCGGELLRWLGWWTLPCIVHLYVDTILEHVGRTAGVLRWCPEVLVEHLHHSVGKSKFDPTYERRWNGEPHAEKDRECFRKWADSPETADMLRRLAAIARSTAAGSATPG